MSRFRVCVHPRTAQVHKLSRSRNDRVIHVVQPESQRGGSEATGHCRQQCLISNIRLELLVRGGIPERQLRDLPELISHVAAAAAGGSGVLGEEIVPVVSGILLVIASGAGVVKRFAFWVAGLVMFVWDNG